MIFKNLMPTLFVRFYESTGHRPLCCFHYWSMGGRPLSWSPMIPAFWCLCPYTIPSPWVWTGFSDLLLNNGMHRGVRLSFLKSGDKDCGTCLGLSLWLFCLLPVLCWELLYRRNTPCVFLLNAHSTTLFTPFLTPDLLGEEVFFDTNNSLWHHLGVNNSIQFWH